MNVDMHHIEHDFNFHIFYLDRLIDYKQRNLITNLIKNFNTEIQASNSLRDFFLIEKDFFDKLQLEQKNIRAQKSRIRKFKEDLQKQKIECSEKFFSESEVETCFLKAQKNYFLRLKNFYFLIQQ